MLRCSERWHPTSRYKHALKLQSKEKQESWATYSVERCQYCSECKQPHLLNLFSETVKALRQTSFGLK